MIRETPQRPRASCHTASCSSRLARGLGRYLEFADDPGEFGLPDPARGILRREPLAAALTGFGKPARASLYLERKDPDHTGDDLPLRHVFRIAVEADRLGKDRAPYPCFLPCLALRGLGLGPVAHRPALGDDPAPGVTAGDEKD